VRILKLAFKLIHFPLWPDTIGRVVIERASGTLDCAEVLRLHLLQLIGLLYRSWQSCFVVYRAGAWTFAFLLASQQLIAHQRSSSGSKEGIETWLSDILVRLAVLALEHASLAVFFESLVELFTQLGLLNKLLILVDNH